MRCSALAAPCLLAAALALAGGAACAGAPPTGGRPPAGLSDRDAREVLRRCAAAVRDGRLDEALPLLSARWRAAYDPGRLALDWRGAGPAAGEAAARVLAALDAGAPLERGPASARLATAPGRTARVIAEAGGWRVDALE